MDDGGIFTYHAQASDLLSCFEYADEASCILDRTGASYRLLAGEELRLSGAHGTVDFSWLREQWRDAQKRDPGRYRVRRFNPVSRDMLLADLFETLDIDQRSGLLGSGSHGRVEDRYGHLYRVVSRPGRKHARVGSAAVERWYVEVERR